MDNYSKKLFTMGLTSIICLSSTVVIAEKTSLAEEPPVIKIVAQDTEKLHPLNDDISKKEEAKDGRDKFISPKIPMDLSHQEYLYDLCQERDLDYITALAIVRMESSFNPQLVHKGCHGYMQISQVNHKNLVKTLKTKNKPTDPFVNLNWGSHMLTSIYDKYKKQGLTGQALDSAALSTYNRGEGGYKKHGQATAYLKRVNKEKQWIKKQLGL